MLTRSYQPEDDAPLPRGLAVALALACIALGVWASYITLKYFEHGAAALEGDEAIRSLAIAAALMFVTLEMAAFGLAALLPRRRLRAARWKLIGFAGAVLAFECATIILVQHAITKGADLTASAGDSRIAELRASIEAQRATAAGLRENAAAQSASRFRQSREAGAAALRDSLAIEQQIRAQSAELATLEAARKPTTSQILGETGALAYAVARGLLVSIAGLVFFGAAGALLRSARGARAAAAPVPAPAAGADDAPAAAPGALPDSAKVVPLKRPDGRFALAAAGAAGLAAFASPTPAQAVTVPHQTASPNVKRFDFEAPRGASISKQSGAEKQEAKQPKKQRRAVSLAAGKKIDTGVGDTDGSRYQRVREAVQSGALKPSIRAIQKQHGGSPRTVQGYLAQLAAEGITERTASGTYRLAGERLAA